jgi:hypothetical protein
MTDPTTPEARSAESDPEDLLNRNIAVVAFDYAPGDGVDGKGPAGAPQAIDPSPSWKPLPLTKAGADQLRALLTGAGATDQLAGVEHHNRPADVIDHLEQLLYRGLGEDDTLCIYLGGHGDSLGDDHFIVGPATEPNLLSSRTALSAADLGNVLAQSRARRVLLLLDACYSGGGADRAVGIFASVTSRLESQGLKDLTVISSAHPLDEVPDGIFVEALLDLLQGNTKRWTEKDRYIDSNQLYRALHDKLDVYDVKLQHRAINDLGPVLPNPNVDAASPDIELALKRRTQDHFVRSASSLEIGESRWFFTGRRAILTKIADWLRAGDGMFVVTGPPGSGKSAILGRVALLADRAGRSLVAERDRHFDPEATSTPPIGSITVAVHAKDKRADQVRSEIVQTLDLDDQTRGKAISSDDEFLAVLDTGPPITVLLDALDEATPGEANQIAELLAELASRGHRALVGTRPDHARRVGLPGTGQGSLLRSLGRPDPNIDLGDDPEAGRLDVADYLTRRLTDPTEPNHYRDDGVARVVASAQTARIGANFLFARLSAQLLLHDEPLDPSRPNWERRLPTIANDDEFASTVETDLNRIVDPDRRQVVRELLMAVAFAEGAGLPRLRVWPAVAKGITGRTYTDDDIQAVLDDAAWYLVESTDGRQTVYRLFHEELARHFRQVAIDEF